MPNAIVFGATSGIGKQLANYLVADGYKVAITGRRLQKLNTIKTTKPNRYFVWENDVQNVDRKSVV